MEKNFEKYLPIGSVVILKEAKKRMMVVGYMVSTPDKPGKVFDYIGCLYPEGLIDPKKNLLFDHNQIALVYALGYSDDEQKKFMNILKENVVGKSLDTSGDSVK